MKKLKLFFACVFLCTATAFADILVNEENFPDPNFRAWILLQSWGSKGYITDAEIANIASINVFGRNISDLTGINFFANLTTLIVNSNRLSSLDVSDLTSLISLSAINNRFSSLDLPELTNLTSLNVTGNQLTSLNVSNLTNLTSLIIQTNRLTSLDLSNLTNLTNLDVHNNRLISLDVSNLTNLSRLRVSNNQLTSLDISGLTSLEDLYLCNNQLTSIDVSVPTSLEALYLRNNQLTSIDVSGLTNLMILNVSINQLTSLDLAGLNNLITIDGSNQKPTLTLAGTDSNYSVEIELNNPTNLVSGLSYFNGILTSTSNTITSSPFTVETGNTRFRLSGTLTLKYTDGTSIPEINLNRTPVAFYTITGVRLGQKPQSGIFIILYCDGSAERVMR